MPGKVGGKHCRSMLDTGATKSCVSSRLVDPAFVVMGPRVLIRVANGDVVVCEQYCAVTVDLGPVKRSWRCLVMNTSAFEIVLGLDFMFQCLLLKSSNFQPP